MAGKKRGTQTQSPTGATGRKSFIGSRNFRLEIPSRAPISVKHLARPPRVPQRDRVHPRRVLPLVRAGREREFHSLTRELGAHIQGVLRATGDDIEVLRNTELSQPAQSQLASSVGEPSVSASGTVVMYTGNWYAARSIDGGQTFQYINPFNAFPDPPNLGYCCDQVVNYLPSIDTFVWLLQYGPKSGPEADNIQRLAFATSAEVQSGSWRLFDITTESLGLAGQFLDFPDLAVGTNFLYVTTNVFTPAGQSAGAAIVRIPIESIKEGPVTASSHVSEELNSLRVAQNCGTVACFAAHVDTSTLRVFKWDEQQSDPISSDVGVARWIGGQGYHSTMPNGQRWLDRIDPRITGATLAGNDLWFAWSVDKGSNLRPNAFVQIARIDAASLTLIENVNVFDLSSATAYGALSTNADGEVGISYMIGGSQQFPSHMVGILTGTRKDVLVAAGDRGPLDGQWGDYLTVRPVFPDRKLFAATGYTMKGPGDGSNRDATPRYVVFGRSGSASPAAPGPAPGAMTPRPPVPPSAPNETPPSDGPPITDVNTLQVVSPAVAAQIKAAASAAPAPAAAGELAAMPEADSPGTERWPVKTGTDDDRAKVGKNVVNGEDLGPGIVEATVEELIAFPRPAGLTDATQDPPQFQSVRANITECTIWRIEATITALKHEKDGDYHLVLQGASGATMVGEIPTPTTEFVGDSPWIGNMADARQAVDDKLVKHLSPAAFALVGGRYLPVGAATFQRTTTAAPGLKFETPPPGSKLAQPLFSTRIPPTPVRLTGVGFFDRAHGATGAAPNVIELHPILKVEWL